MSDPRLLIDIHALDEALINNPSLVQDVCNEAAEAIAIRDAKKEALATVDAELDAIVRDELGKTTKVTEDKVKAAIQVHPKHARAFEEANAAKLAAAKADATVKSVETRSKSIEQLSYLHNSGYFTINSTKRISNPQEVKYTRDREVLSAHRARPTIKG
jgi:hypothetical protein